MKAEKSKRNSKNKAALNNKKHKNNKILKAKDILAKNKAALTKEAEKRSPALKILKIVKNIFFGILIFVLAVVIISFLVVRINGGTPAVFGYSIQRVASGSMEPTLKVGDIILGKSVTSPDEIGVDDIITFQGDSSFEYNHVTHRVIIPPMENADGDYVLTTKGDANPVEDKAIPFSSVQFKYIRTLDFLNNFYDFFLSPWGLVIFIAALLIIFFDELMTVVRVVTGNYNEEEDEDIGEIMTRLKAEEVEAFLQYQQEQERKKRRRAKHSNTSVKKQKNRKKSAEQKADKTAQKHAKKNPRKNPKKNTKKNTKKR